MIKLDKMIRLFQKEFLYVLSVAELIISISLEVNGKRTLALILAIAFVVSLVLAVFKSIDKTKKGKKITPTIIEGKPVDLLMVADAFRTQMDSVEVTKVTHKAFIMENNDLSIVWNYSGSCIKKEGESSFVFSIQGGNDTPLEKLDCYGYDLLNDPDRKNKIYATLLPTQNGLSVDYKVKKIIVPFLKKLNQGDNFSIELHYTWPNCIVYKEDYYISSLSFKVDKLADYQVILEFEKINPKWVRVYDGNGNLLKHVAQSHTRNRFHVYIDSVSNPSSKSTLIYKFYREEP